MSLQSTQSPAGSRRGGDSAPVLFWDRAYTAAGRPASTIAIDIVDPDCAGWCGRGAPWPNASDALARLEVVAELSVRACCRASFSPGAPAGSPTRRLGAGYRLADTYDGPKTILLRAASGTIRCRPEAQSAASLLRFHAAHRHQPAALSGTQQLTSNNEQSGETTCDPRPMGVLRQPR